MYWKFNHTSSPHIDVLLSNKDVSVLELLDEEDVIQECKVQNKKLIEFISRPCIMEELVSLTLEPPNDVEEQSRYKYPNIACELLTCDVPAINERIAGDENLLEKLYRFLEQEAPLNPLLASFFSKLLGVLITRKAEQNWYSYQFTCLQVLEFLKSKENCIDLLLKHLGTSAIMDLLLKLITQIEGLQMRQNALTWLKHQELVQKLVALLDPSVDPDRHANASQLLCDVIKMLRENQLSSTDRATFDPLLDTIESSETVTQLLDHMLGPEKCETAIVGGISVLLALLDQGKESSAINTIYGGTNVSGDDSVVSDSEHILRVIRSTTEAIIPRLKDFHSLLLDPPSKPAVKTTAGVLDPPVGLTRLQVARLFAVLVSTNNAMVNKEMATLGTVEVLLDLFFKYTWNNFLHTQVEKCIAFALNSELNCTNGDEPQARILLSHIFVQCRLVQQILCAWEENENQQSKPGGLRLGYMGHLIKIANHVAQHTEKEPLVSLLKEHLPADTVTQWETFTANALAETNKTHQLCMGGSHPGQSSSEDSNSEYPDISIPFSQGGLQQTYPDYEIPQPTQQMIENYNFQDDEIPDIDESGQLKDGIGHQEHIFKLVCAQKSSPVQSLDDSVWDDQDQELNFQPVMDTKTSNWQNDDEGAGDSSDEDDKVATEGTEVVHMEIDSMDPWDVADMEAVAPIVEDAANPWGNSAEAVNETASAPSDQGWADFGSGAFANFEANFGSSLANEGSKVNGSLKTENTGTILKTPETVNELVEQFGTMGTNTVKEQTVNLLPEETVLSSCSRPFSHSDDNANCNSSSDGDPQLLMDNYRFLSAQGLITGSVNSCSTSKDSHADVDVSDSSCISSSSDTSSKQCGEDIINKLPDCEIVLRENGPIELHSPVDHEDVSPPPVPKENEAESTTATNGPV